MCSYELSLWQRILFQLFGRLAWFFTPVPIKQSKIVKIEEIENRKIEKGKGKVKQRKKRKGETRKLKKIKRKARQGKNRKGETRKLKKIKVRKRRKTKARKIDNL